MSKIPEPLVDRHKQGVAQLKFYGVPVAELNRDEQLAMINVLSVELRETRHRLLVNIELSTLARRKNS